MQHPYNKNEIVFPVIIPGNKLDGKIYTWNSCTAPVKRIGEFGYTTNGFYGGRCVLLGFIPELGFWGCQEKSRNTELAGFLLQDPETLTDLGRELAQKAFPMQKLVFISIDDVPEKPKDPKRLAKAQEKAEKMGFTPQVVKGAQVETLESLIEAKLFEEEQEKKAVEAAVPAEKPKKPASTTTAKKVVASKAKSA